MNKDAPKNTPLSGMIITALAAAVVLPLGFVSADFRALMNHSLTPELLNALPLTMVLMAVHKAESYWFKEYDHCPVYLTSGRAAWAANPRQAIFLSFVPTFIGMLFLLYFALLGPPWHLIILCVWLAQGLHELHHLAKSLARRQWYPGIVSSLFFSGVIAWVLYPRWYDRIFAVRGPAFHAYYIAMAVTVCAFWIEDRYWNRPRFGLSTSAP